MPVPVLVSAAGWIIGTMMFNRILSDVADDPEGKLATEIAKREFRAQQALQEPFYTAAHEAEIAPRYQLPTEDIRMESSMVGQGLMDVEIAGPGSRALMDRVSARIGMTSEQFSAKINPMRAGDTSSLSQAAFGRTPNRVEK